VSVIFVRLTGQTDGATICVARNPVEEA
jgi:hypothetical protein